MITSAMSNTKLAYGGQWLIFLSWLKCSMHILIEKFVNVIVCRGQIMPFRLIVMIAHHRPRQIKQITAHVSCKLTR